MQLLSRKPPCIVLGGRANALSVVRSLSRMRVRTCVFRTADGAAGWSRHATIIGPDHPTGPADWLEWLKSDDSAPYRGAVLLACDDQSIQLIARNHTHLSALYRLEESAPQVRIAMLDKLTTYRIAAAADVPTPGHWMFDSVADAQRLAPTLPYPVIMKPQFSPDGLRIGAKYLRTDTPDAFVAAARRTIELAVPCVAMEFIPGPDRDLCSYYSYLDADGTPLVHFTKTLLRRNPPNMGAATYHLTRWIPEAAELGLRFFQAAGLRGLGNVEFKRDPRDGRLKLIECNARFTASNALLVESGLDLARLTYCRIVGLPLPDVGTWREGVTLAYPLEDIAAAMALRRNGQLSMGRWLMELAQVDCLPYFAWTDPLPSLHALAGRLRLWVQRRGPQRRPVISGRAA